MVRLVRLYLHLFGRLSGSRSPLLLPYKGLVFWLGDLVFLTADILFLPEIHDGLSWIAGKRSRTLTDVERTLLSPIFRQSVDYRRVRLYDKMPKLFTRWAHAFVFANTINYRGQIRADVLVHEMVHIWQYQRYGSAYIWRALRAQASTEGYDYGGIEKLYAGMTSGRSFVDFNFEQQGDIIQDAYLQLSGVRGINNAMYSAIYNYYLSQLEY